MSTGKTHGPGQHGMGSQCFTAPSEAKANGGTKAESKTKHKKMKSSKTQKGRRIPWRKNQAKKKGRRRTREKGVRGDNPTMYQ